MTRAEESRALHDKYFSNYFPFSSVKCEATPIDANTEASVKFSVQKTRDPLTYRTEETSFVVTASRISGFTISFSLQVHADDVSEAQVATGGEYATRNENVNKEISIPESHYGSTSSSAPNQQQIQPERAREQAGACPLSNSAGAAAEMKDAADSYFSDATSSNRRNGNLVRNDADGAGISTTKGTPVVTPQPSPRTDVACPLFDTAFSSTARAPVPRDFHAIRESSESSDSDESTSSSQPGETRFAFTSFKRFATNASAAIPQLTQGSVSTQKAQGPDTPPSNSIGNTEQYGAPAAELAAPLAPTVFGYTIPSATDSPTRTLGDSTVDPTVTGTGFSIIPGEAKVSIPVVQCAPQPGTPISWKPWTPDMVPPKKPLRTSTPAVEFPPIDLCGHGPVILPGIARTKKGSFIPHREYTGFGRKRTAECYQSVCAVREYARASHEEIRLVYYQGYRGKHNDPLKNQNNLQETLHLDPQSPCLVAEHSRSGPTTPMLAASPIRPLTPDHNVTGI